MDREQQIKKCVEILDYAKTTWNPFGWFSSGRDLDAYPKDIVKEATIIWHRRTYSSLYEAINSLCNNFIRISISVFGNDKYAKAMPIVACGMALMTIKHDHRHDPKIKNAATFLCENIIENHFKDADVKMDLTYKIINMLSDPGNETDMEFVFASAIASAIRQVDNINILADDVIAVVDPLLKEFQKSSFK